ncbi:MAG: hypothetical protein H0X37_17570 [Herpetosiphonaceae bacterium]|nr:hypothetical protein [Herpetosiphonaceae bacterium]
MSNTGKDLAWMVPYLNLLPRVNDPIFTEVWQNNRFAFENLTTRFDKVDLYSARLVCAAMHNNQRLLVVLPDRALHRPPLLFATCLVMDALDSIRYPDIEPNKVAYFGTSIGIREQLSAVKLHDLYLDNVFPTYRIARGTTEATVIPSKRSTRSRRTRGSLANSLPQVVCAYSPADPGEVIDHFEPTWLAVDCSDTDAIRWLPSLLEYAEHLDLPVVAWCQNPLAAAVHDFDKAGGLVFRWPKAYHFIQTIENESEQPENYEHQTNIKPLVIDFQSPDVSVLLQRAYSALAELARSSNIDQRLLRDALNIGWRYLQALELLPVPLALYEVEVHRFWNSATLAQLQQTLGHFVDAIKDTYPQALLLLQTAHEALCSVHAVLTNNEPPMWTALMSVCSATREEHTSRVLVFSTEFRRQLFILGILARHNTSEHDLRSRGIWVTTLKAWHREHAKYERERMTGKTHPTDEHHRLPLDKPYTPIIVGLPSTRQSVNIEPLFDQIAGAILLYPYQKFALLHRVQEWNAAVAPAPLDQAECLAQLARETIDLDAVPTMAPRVIVVGADDLRVTVQPVSRPSPTTPWKPLDPVQELTRLFEADEDMEATEIGAEERSGSSVTADQSDMSWVDSIVELQLEGGWHATFAVNDMLQVVVGKNDAHIEERYVRSLRQHDRILFIVGQRRQNLYDLIIARVHAHPAIELHLALVRRWHEELPNAYGRWKQQHGGSLDGLLAALKSEGSRLMSTQTLRLWLAGQVLCPEDAGDLRRLARVLDMPFVRDNYRQIDKAARRLRGIHIALANRLNRWLQQEAVGALQIGEPDTSVLDKELGLTFSDFRASLLILSVESIQERKELYLRSSLGQLEREES